MKHPRRHVLAVLLASAAYATLAPRPAAAQNFFVANRNGDSVGEYNAATGTAVNAAFLTTTNAVSGPVGLALAGNTLYVSNTKSSNTVRAYDATTGAAVSGFTPISPGIDPSGLTVGGGLLYATSGSAGTVNAYDAATGVAANGFAPITGLSAPRGLARFGNVLYISNEGTKAIETYNATTGALLNASFLTGFTNADFLTLSGSVLYISDRGDSNVQAFNLAMGTALAGFTTISDANSPAGVAVFNNVLFVANAGNNTIGEYNATTGAAINAAAITNGLSVPQGLAFPAPEPSTWTLLILGTGGLCFLTRRRA